MIKKVIILILIVVTSLFITSCCDNRSTQSNETVFITDSANVSNNNIKIEFIDCYSSGEYKEYITNRLLDNPIKINELCIKDKLQKFISNKSINIIKINTNYYTSDRGTLYLFSAEVYYTMNGEK
jgi:hypothetical protein